MLIAARNKAACVLLAALTVLMLAGTPLVVPSVYASDCPNPSAGSC